MFVMRNEVCTPATVHSVISDGPAYQFGMENMARIRVELIALIAKLSPIYNHSKSLEEDVESTGSVVVSWLPGDKEPEHKEPEPEPVSEALVDGSLYEAMVDHGGKQPSTVTPKQSAATSKHSPQQSCRRRNARSDSPPREMMDLFHSDAYALQSHYAPPKSKRNKKTGAQRVTGRVIARNAKNVHLTVPKQKRTDHQSKERAIAKRFDAELRKHPVTDEEIDTVLASSLDISVSQISEWERGEVSKYSSQELLGLCSILLSLEVVEKEEDSN